MYTHHYSEDGAYNVYVKHRLYAYADEALSEHNFTLSTGVSLPNITDAPSWPVLLRLSAECLFLNVPKMMQHTDFDTGYNFNVDSVFETRLYVKWGRILKPDQVQAAVSTLQQSIADFPKLGAHMPEWVALPNCQGPAKLEVHLEVTARIYGYASKSGPQTSVVIMTRVPAAPSEGEFMEHLAKIRAGAAKAWSDRNGNISDFDVNGWGSNYSASFAIKNMDGAWSVTRQDSAMRELDKFLRYIKGLVRVR